MNIRLWSGRYSFNLIFRAWTRYVTVLKKRLCIILKAEVMVLIDFIYCVKKIIMDYAAQAYTNNDDMIIIIIR